GGDGVDRRAGRDAAGHRRTAAGAAVDGDLALVQVDEALDDGKPKACAALPATLRIGREAVEEAVQHLLRNAGAVVGHRKEDIGRVAPAGEGDRAALGGEIDGVGEKLE